MTAAAKTEQNFLQEVREQYENYPYPPRDPQQEKIHCQYSHTCALDALNYYHYSGRRDFSKGFRVLVAGGGTGDSAIMLAEQLREFDAHITYLDISQSSLNVAKERAKIRGLNNVNWVHGSLLDAPKLFDEPFDYINCIGVLHHLEVPELGIQALAKVLKDDGVIGIMLYAQYGRQAVYQVQDLMKLLNRGEKNLQRKVDNCKLILKSLPQTHNFATEQHLSGDIVEGGDVGIYDLLLHSHDVAYTVPQVYRFLESANLNLTHFFFNTRAMTMGNNLYNMHAYLKDGALKDQVDALSLEEQQAAAELMHGKIDKHVFYAAKKTPAIPAINEPEMVPCYSILLERNFHAQMAEQLKPLPTGEMVNLNFLNRQLTFLKTPNLETIFTFMDGEKTVAEIIGSVKAVLGAASPANADLIAEFHAIFTSLRHMDLIYLRHKSVPRLKSIFELQRRMQQTQGYGP